MITSTSNQKVKELIQLQKKAKARDQAGVFLTEGIRSVREAPRDRLTALYVSESFSKRHPEMPKELGVTAEVLTDTVFDYVSDTKTPQGVLGVFRQMEYTPEQMLGSEAPHILVLDNLQDPGNLGTIFRTAEAAGVSGIILSSDCVDIYNPKTIRSTMGAVFRMPFCYVTDVLPMIGMLKRHGVRVYAAHLDGTHSYDHQDYTGGTAFLIGNEGNGLRREVAAQADTWVRIPMAGKAESLNAAVAAGILMFEVSRQRRMNE